MKKIGVRVLFAVFLLLAVFGNVSHAKAASAAISIDADEKEVTVGSEVTVRLLIQATENIGGFEAFLTYDSSTLSFRSADDGIAGGDGLLRISDMEPVTRSRSKTYEITFQARKVGGCEINLKDKAYVYEDDGGNEMSVSCNSLSIRVEAEEEASSEARLADLKISPGTLDPEFSPDVSWYQVSVDADTERLVVSALPEDEGATVEVSGNQSFQTGMNEVVIKVRAENEAAQTYLLHVTKESGGEKETGENGNNDGEPGMDQEGNETDGKGTAADGFSIEESGDGFLVSGAYSYYVADSPAEALPEVPEGYEPYTMVLYGKRVPAYKKVGDADPIKVLLYAESKDGISNFYELDLETKQVERIVFRTEWKEAGMESAEPVQTSWGLYAAIVGLAVLSAILATALIRVVQNRRI